MVQGGGLGVGGSLRNLKQAQNLGTLRNLSALNSPLRDSIEVAPFASVVF